MNIYIDTEFNDFKGDLISMALVTESGDAWYQSLGCNNPSKWVAEHVMPVINKPPISIDAMQGDLHNFLSFYSTIHIIADWPEDIQHFCELLIVGAGTRINTPPLTMEIRRDLDNTSETSEIPHNALEDAVALRRSALLTPTPK